MCLVKHRAIKTYVKVEVQLHVFLTSAVDGGDSSASHSGRSIPGERTLGTHCIRGCVGPRTGLDSMEEREISASSRNRIVILRLCSP
jgi:hypothetical protein